MISYHDDIKSNYLFTQLINLRQKGLVREHLQQFQKSSLGVDGILDDKLLNLFIETLKDNIQHEVHLFEPTSLDKDFMVARKDERKKMAMDTKRTTSHTYKENNVPSSNPTQRLTPQHLNERKEKILCFNCDNKYSTRHKYSENKLLYIDYEEEEPKE